MKPLRRLAPAALLLVLALAAPASAAGSNPPDQVDPPAEGEGKPLDDPTDPTPSAYSSYGYQSVRLDMTTERWNGATVDKTFGRDATSTAIALSRKGWAGGARRVVLTSRSSFQQPLVAAPLAAALKAPLLLTARREVPAAVRAELKRLKPDEIVIVGDPGTAVGRVARRLAPKMTRVRGDNLYATSMAVARKLTEINGAPNGVVVVNTWRPAPSLGAAAFAAGKQWPVLFTPAGAEPNRLRGWTDELGPKRTVVIGGRAVVSDRTVAGLPGLERLAGRNSLHAAAVVANRGRALGLDGRPALIANGSWGDAAVVGAFVGGRRRGVVLTTKTRSLSRASTRWLRNRQPRAISLMGRARLARVVGCQVSTGRTRSWRCAERELKRQGYDIRQADGQLDRFSIWAVYAFKKVAGRRPNNVFGNADWSRMLDNPRRPVRRKDLPSTHIEIDLGRQLVLVVEKGRVKHHLHTSTGKPSTPTVRGTFSVYEKRNVRQANRMYRPVFFYRGYAFHGYPEIPLYPASAGCARMYDGNMDFLYPKLFYGERIATY